MKKIALTLALLMLIGLCGCVKPAATQTTTPQPTLPEVPDITVTETTAAAETTAPAETTAAAEETTVPAETTPAEETTAPEETTAAETELVNNEVDCSENRALTKDELAWAEQVLNSPDYNGFILRHYEDIHHANVYDVIYGMSDGDATDEMLDAAQVEGEERTEWPWIYLTLTTVDEVLLKTTGWTREDFPQDLTAAENYLKEFDALLSCPTDTNFMPVTVKSGAQQDGCWIVDYLRGWGEEPDGTGVWHLALVPTKDGGAHIRSNRNDSAAANIAQWEALDKNALTALSDGTYDYWYDPATSERVVAEDADNDEYGRILLFRDGKCCDIILKDDLQAGPTNDYYAEIGEEVLDAFQKALGE